MSDEAGREKYPHVFQPFKLGPVEVQNRLFFGPHGIPLEAPTPGHEAYHVPSSEAPYYYGERAAGGIGLILHSTLLSPLARQQTLSATPWFEESIPSYAKIAEKVHEHGSKIMAELWYVGFMPHTWEMLGPEAPVLGPSPTAQFYMPSSWREMRREEIARFVDDYARDARHLRSAGYDGVEIHVSHSSVVECFLSPSFNRRTDDYGGSLENRARFLVEIAEAIRKEIEGADMALGIRFTTDELLANGWDADGAREILRYLDGTGLLDFVDFDISVEPEQQNLMTTNFFEPKHHNLQRVHDIAPAAGSMAKIAVPGRVTKISEAEAILEHGVLDMVGAVRGLIAEPRMARNALEGREEVSRVCIAANHCLEAAMLGGFGCAVNPEAGKEVRWGRRTHTPAANKMRVLVVGGGPAGLEAARVAAHRGHEVTLVERRANLGGALALWAKLPGRDHLATLVEWQKKQMARLGVTVEVGVDLSSDDVLAREPEVVVLATGSRYSADGDGGFLRSPIPGADQAFVYTPEDVLEGGAMLSGNVVVLDEDGSQAASGLAEIAAAGGAKVTIVTRKASPGAHQIFHVSYLIGRLMAAGVQIVPGCYIREIGAQTVTLYPVMGGPDWSVDADAVVLATSRKPVTDLEDLTTSLPYVYLVGDAMAPRTLREATYEGYRFGRLIGDPDMPATVIVSLYQEMPALVPAEFA